MPLANLQDSSIGDRQAPSSAVSRMHPRSARFARRTLKLMAICWPNPYIAPDDGSTLVIHKSPNYFLIVEAPGPWT